MIFRVLLIDHKDLVGFRFPVCLCLLAYGSTSVHPHHGENKQKRYGMVLSVWYCMVK